MSQRAAWQLERLGFDEVYDFVVGKAHWLASGRPTTRSAAIERVGSAVTAAVTAFVDDTVAVARETAAGSSRDIVVVNHRQIVAGKVRHSELEAANGTDLMGAIMRLGPTTIRPDELAKDVSQRMSNKDVKSILVTRTTGELLGEFAPTQTPGDE